MTMKRRNFITALAALPFVGKAFAKEETKKVLVGERVYYITNDAIQTYDHDPFERVNSSIKEMGEIYAEHARIIYSRVK